MGLRGCRLRVVEPNGQRFEARQPRDRKEQGERLPRGSAPTAMPSMAYTAPTLMTPFELAMFDG